MILFRHPSSGNAGTWCRDPRKISRCRVTALWALPSPFTRSRVFSSLVFRSRAFALFSGALFSGDLASGAAVDAAAGAYPLLGAPAPARRRPQQYAAATARRDSFCIENSSSAARDPITSEPLRTPGFWRGGWASTHFAWPAAGREEESHPAARPSPDRSSRADADHDAAYQVDATAAARTSILRAPPIMGHGGRSCLRSPKNRIDPPRPL